MSEAAWLQIIGGLFTLITVIATTWLTVHYKMKGLVTTTTEIKTQNAAQETKLDTVTKKVEGVREEINGRLTQWKRDLEENTANAVKAAALEGIVRGAELERTTKTSSVQHVLVAAKLVEVKIAADRLLAAAEIEAEKVMTAAEFEAQKVMTAAKEAAEELIGKAIAKD